MSVICFLAEAQFSFLTSCVFMCKYRRVMLETFFKQFCFHSGCRWPLVEEQMPRVMCVCTLTDAVNCCDKPCGECGLALA